MTTHLIASFPAGTDPKLAHAASRAWTEELFGSGLYGGKYDYVTAFHTDTDHPHMHVMVNRRALDSHGWLKISNRPENINWQFMRDLLRDISAEFGIVLNSSTRKERQIFERPKTSAQYRREEREELKQQAKKAAEEALPDIFPVTNKRVQRQSNITRDE